MATEVLPIPPGGVPQLDELYSVSDLHLGGSPDFQIFNSGLELKKLIDYLRDYRPQSKIGFLINGDFVDFLAQGPEPRHFDPVGAVDKLKEISEDPAFKPVFDALAGFTAKPNRLLIITLGNHDLELALPWVRTSLLNILSGGKEASRGRITLAFDGTGYRCKVGNATVLCVHGNEVDPWNLADYERIRRFGRDVVQGRPVDSWIPNAGSQLVIEVMNGIKRDFPFVDLLKPETQAAVPILLTLAPNQRDKLRAIGATVRRLAWDKIRSATGFLGANVDEQALTGRTVAYAGMLPGGSPSFLGTGVFEDDRKEYAAMLLDATEEKLNLDVSAMSLISADQRGADLGLGSALMKLFKGADTSEVLREALSDLRHDRSFDPTAEDETFKLLDEQVGEGIEFVIAGHTHLARALARKHRPGWYFNSGTWARLIKLEAKVLDDPVAFREVFEVFKRKTMKALDAAPELVKRRLSVVAIRSEGPVTHGELREVSISPDEPVLPEATDYRFTNA